MKCRVYRDLGVIRIFDAGCHLSEPRLFVGFWQPPPTLVYQLYLLKILKNTDHPAKTTSTTPGIFQRIHPRDIGPPPEVKVETSPPFRHLEEVAHEEHGGKTLHRNQATTSNRGHTNWGKRKRTSFLHPKKWGKKTPFLKMMVKDFWEASEFPVSTDFEGTYLVSSPLGVFDGFLASFGNQR